MQRDEYEEIAPDRSFSDYYCSVCQSHMNSNQMWLSHIAGKRHQKNIKKESGEGPSKTKTIKVEGRFPDIQKMLDEFQSPLVGLSFVVERQAAVRGGENIYQCHLCQGSCTRSNVIEHLCLTKHKLFYFKQKDGKFYIAIDGMKHLSKQTIECLVDDHATEWERDHGRELMQVEVMKTVDWSAVKYGRRNYSQPWNDKPKSSHRSHSHSPQLPDVDPSAQNQTNVESSEHDVQCFSLDSIKKNFTKFDPNEKLELIQSLCSSLCYETTNDRNDCLKLCTDLQKIFYLAKIRDLPADLLERCYLDMCFFVPTISDVVLKIVRGEKSYFLLNRPI